MTHLTDEQLNEYLDAGTQVDMYTRTQVHLTPDTSHLTPLTRHLDTCPDCQTRLEELRSLFTAIESLPEVASPDLTSFVMAKLPAPSWGGMVSRRTRTWTWLSAAQALGALAILAWLASSFVLPPEIATYQPPTIDSLLVSMVSSLTAFTLDLSTFNEQISSFIFHPSSLDLQSTTILTFVISAAILWLVGNGLLLRTPARDSRK